jgi:AraC-like DNA-binding protein
MTSNALQTCRLDSALGGSVQIVEGASGDRKFSDRLTESLGVCLKIGENHDVQADGKVLQYPRNALCVRTPGCVWSVKSTGRVGFFSIDIGPELLPAGGLQGGMKFANPVGFPDLRDGVSVLRSPASSPLQKQTLITDWINALLDQCLVTSFDLGPEPPQSAADRALELLASRLDNLPSLQEMSVVIGGNRFVLLREFRKKFGLPPHALALRLRVNRACSMLDRGIPPSEISNSLGFADQSHFGRVFKRIVGLSPGQYRKRLVVGLP